MHKNKWDCFNKVTDDHANMTSIKIVQFSRPPTPLALLHPKFSHPLDLGRPVSNEPPPPSSLTPLPNDDQSVKSKHNPRMTIICYQILTLGRLSFSISTY